MGQPLVSLPEFLRTSDAASLDNYTLERLLDEPKLADNIQQCLDSLGFRKLRFFRCGKHAAVFSGTKDQMIRISFEHPHEGHLRPQEPFILQPIHSEKLSNGALIEVLPKVRTEEISDRHKKDIKETLRNAGYVSGDQDKPGNIGLMTCDGRTFPVLVDCGYVQSISADPIDNARFREVYKQWLDDDGMWLQRKVEQRTKPSNVIDGKEAERIQQIMDSVYTGQSSRDDRLSDQIKAAVLQDGLYEDEFSTLRDRVIERLAREDKSYAELMDEERARMNVERNQQSL